MFPFQTQRLLSWCIALLSCVLVVSFFLHTIDVHHVHPGEHHDAAHADESVATSEYIHGNEKKLFFITLVSFLLLGFFVGTSATSVCAIVNNLNMYGATSTRSRKGATIRSHTYFHLLYSSGILNPRLFN
jgi:hypothetical protein